MWISVNNNWFLLTDQFQYFLICFILFGTMMKSYHSPALFQYSRGYFGSGCSSWPSSIAAETVAFFGSNSLEYSVKNPNTIMNTICTSSRSTYPDTDDPGVCIFLRSRGHFLHSSMLTNRQRPTDVKRKIFSSEFFTGPAVRSTARGRLIPRRSFLPTELTGRIQLKPCWYCFWRWWWDDTGFAYGSITITTIILMDSKQISEVDYLLAVSRSPTPKP